MIYGVLEQLEGLGLLRNTAEYQSLIVAEEDKIARGRINAKYPLEPTPDWHQTAVVANFLARPIVVAGGVTA